MPILKPQEQPNLDVQSTDTVIDWQREKVFRQALSTFQESTTYRKMSYAKIEDVGRIAWYNSGPSILW